MKINNKFPCLLKVNDRGLSAPLHFCITCHILDCSGRFPPILNVSLFSFQISILSERPESCNIILSLFPIRYLVFVRLPICSTPYVNFEQWLVTDIYQPPICRCHYPFLSHHLHPRGVRQRTASSLSNLCCCRIVCHRCQIHPCVCASYVPRIRIHVLNSGVR